MQFRFVGKYTGRHTTINACGVMFEGREPAEVTDADAIRRLAGHPEFEAAELPERAAKPRGRPRKAKQEG